jgi:hypothetical protein
MKNASKIAYIFFVSFVFSNLHAAYRTQTDKHMQQTNSNINRRIQIQESQEITEHLEKLSLEPSARFISRHPNLYIRPDLSNRQRTILISFTFMLLMAQITTVAATISNHKTQTQSSSDSPVEQAEIIKINGVSKPMLGHIVQAQFNPETDPFSVTSVIRFENNKFFLKGDILSLDEDDVTDIANGKFLYVPYYTMQKTRLSHGSYQEVGAIIIGSSDPSLSNRLHFAAVRSVVHKSDSKDKDL